jgi:predicted Zn-dependent peptidase
MIKLISTTIFAIAMVHTATSQTKDPLDAKVYTLSNGLKLYVSPNKTEPKVQTFIAVNAGSKMDPSETTGLAHYLEHLMFKGTPHIGTLDWEKERVLLDQIRDLYEAHKKETDTAKKRAIYAQIDKVSYEASKYAIPNEYDKMISSLGAQGTNAHTNSDETVYKNILPVNELEKWMKIESERFQNLTMRLFHTELEAVYEEYNISQDNDGRWAYQNVLKKLFPNHPYGTQSTIGEGSHLKNPSWINIRNFFETYYVPNNVAICISGDVDPEAMRAMAEKYFGSWKAKEIKPLNLPPLTPIKGVQVIENFGPQEEFVYIGYRLPKATDEEVLKAKLIDQMMSNSTAGLIDINLVQKQKVLQAYSSPILMTDYGVYMMYAKPKQGQTLEEAKDLLLTEMDNFKKGNFDEWLITAAINDMEKSQMIAMQSNTSRAGAFVDAFIKGYRWEDYIAQIDKMKKFTKKDLVDFANKTFGNDYVISYKRKGEQKSEKVEKPKITPVVLNRSSSSEFAKEIMNTKSNDIQPQFVDFDQLIQSEFLTNKTKLSSLKNSENRIGKFAMIFPFGSDHNDIYPSALAYLNLLGTDKLSADDFKKELYKYGLEINASCTRDQIVISILGLDESMPKGVEMLYDLLQHAKADANTWNEMAQNTIKQRENNRSNKNMIMQNMVSYAKYGVKNPANTVISNEALKATNPASLTKAVSDLLSYEHELFYYGNDISKIKSNLPKVYDGKTGGSKLNKKSEFKTVDINDNSILFYNYPGMVQAQIMMVHKDVPFSQSLLPFQNIFNEYFGSGLSSIVFQELREQKALAYGASSVFRMPFDLTENFYLNAFIGTQADKMVMACDEFRKLLNKMPNVPIQYNNAVSSAIKQINAERIVRDDIFWRAQYFNKFGIKNDIRPFLLSQLKDFGIDKFEGYFNQHIANKKYTTVIIGDKSKINLAGLASYGSVKELEGKEIFGY